MPLTFQESKNLMVKMFRLALAASERRSEDAVRSFSDIVDSTFTSHRVEPRVFPFQATYHTGQSKRDDDAVSTISGTSSNDMPPLGPLATASPVYDYFGVSALPHDEEVKLVISEDDAPIQSAVVAEEKPEDKEDDDEVEGEDEEEVEEDDDEVEEEDEIEEEVEEEEVEEEEQELELVPVRIKKVTYWKDELSGDIYQYLPDDECGDKVGTYVDGKPVFD